MARAQNPAFANLGGQILPYAMQLAKEKRAKQAKETRPWDF